VPPTPPHVQSGTSSLTQPQSRRDPTSASPSRRALDGALAAAADGAQPAAVGSDAIPFRDRLFFRASPSLLSPDILLCATSRAAAHRAPSPTTSPPPQPPSSPPTLPGQSTVAVVAHSASPDAPAASLQPQTPGRESPILTYTFVPTVSSSSPLAAGHQLTTGSSRAQLDDFFPTDRIASPVPRTPQETARATIRALRALSQGPPDTPPPSRRDFLLDASHHDPTAPLVPPPPLLALPLEPISPREPVESAPDVPSASAETEHGEECSAHTSARVGPRATPRPTGRAAAPLPADFSSPMTPDWLRQAAHFLGDAPSPAARHASSLARLPRLDLHACAARAPTALRAVPTDPVTGRATEFRGSHRRLPPRALLVLLGVMCATALLLLACLSRPILRSSGDAGAWPQPEAMPRHGAAPPSTALLSGSRAEPMLRVAKDFAECDFAPGTSLDAICTGPDGRPMPSNGVELDGAERTGECPGHATYRDANPKCTVEAPATDKSQACVLEAQKEMEFVTVELDFETGYGDMEISDEELPLSCGEAESFEGGRDSTALYRAVSDADVVRRPLSPFTLLPLALAAPAVRMALAPPDIHLPTTAPAHRRAGVELHPSALSFECSARPGNASTAAVTKRRGTARGPGMQSSTRPSMASRRGARGEHPLPEAPSRVAPFGLFCLCVAIAAGRILGRSLASTARGGRFAALSLGKDRATRLAVGAKLALSTIGATTSALIQHALRLARRYIGPHMREGVSAARDAVRPFSLVDTRTSVFGAAAIEPADDQVEDFESSLVLDEDSSTDLARCPRGLTGDADTSTASTSGPATEVAAGVAAASSSASRVGDVDRSADASSSDAASRSRLGTPEWDAVHGPTPSAQPAAGARATRSRSTSGLAPAAPSEHLGSEQRYLLSPRRDAPGILVSPVRRSRRQSLLGKGGTRTVPSPHRGGGGASLGAESSDAIEARSIVRRRAA